jgi:hypothetical protein
LVFGLGSGINLPLRSDEPMTHRLKARRVVVVLGASLLAGASCGEGGGGPKDGSGQADMPQTGEAKVETEAPDANLTPETVEEPPDVPKETPKPEVTPDVPTGPELPPVDPNLCTGSTSGAVQPPGGSCCYTAADHPTNPNCVWYEAATWKDGLCMDLQCDKGAECFYGAHTPGHCVTPCTYNSAWDATSNATGDKGPDGVVDEVYPNECTGMADGPFGTEYRCVNLSAPQQNILSVCRPGTSFAKCNSNADCPVDEVCTIMFLLGEYGGRCQPEAKGVSEGFGPCNYDPNQGPLQFCAGGYCSSRRSSTFNQCAAFCATDEQCATDACTAGKCTKSGAACSTSADCSAWECDTYAYLDSYTDQWCWPKTCETWDGCLDPDYYCRPFWNGAATVEEVAESPQCRPVGKDAAGQQLAQYGEPCETAPDGTVYPACVWAAGCLDNYCAGPCKADSDCPSGTECLLADEWDLDLDDDTTTDTWLHIDGCVAWEHDGELVDCTSDAECGVGSHCEFRVKGQGDGAARVWEVEYKCKKDRTDELDAFEVCGGSTGKGCQSGLCLKAASGTLTDAMCVPYCAAKADCPASFDFGGYTWKSYCASYLAAHHNTPSPVDDLYVAHCWRTSAFGTLEPCDDHRACPVANNRCRAIAIGGNADQPVTVEHLCVDASEGLSGVPAKRTGEPCDKGSDCFGRMCLDDHDPDNLTLGYCSELCAVDDDCKSLAAGALGDLKCTDFTLIPRANPEHSGKTKRCVVQLACALCTSDEDCGGDYRCSNMGTLAQNADFRCAQTCEVDTDCPVPTDSCIPSLDATGKDLATKFCLPVSCE